MYLAAIRFRSFVGQRELQTFRWRWCCCARVVYMCVCEKVSVCVCCVCGLNAKRIMAYGHAMSSFLSLCVYR